MRKYEQLETKIEEFRTLIGECFTSIPTWKMVDLTKFGHKLADLQKEVERLKDEEKSEMAKDMKETKETNFPTSLDREVIIEVLNGDLLSLIYAFAWFETPQGEGYWRKIYEGLEPLTEDDILYLQKLVILSSQGEIDKD
jgi:hypothetical protein